MSNDELVALMSSVIAGGFVKDHKKLKATEFDAAVEMSVEMARAIIVEVKKTSDDNSVDK